MLLAAAKLNNLPIIALSSGERIGVAIEPVIDWNTLNIMAWRCLHGSSNGFLLIGTDIRQFDGQVLLVNSEDDLIESHEVIRMQPFLEHNFKVVGAQVKTESGTKVGRVSDYTFDLKTLEIQQLYVKQPLLKNLINSNLIIHRLQIIEVAPPVIIVRDANAKEPLAAARPALLK